MATNMQNKISMDLAADDSSSLDSLSFTGLVCIQDQQSKSPTGRDYQNNKDDHHEFEFFNLKKNSHPDMVISDRHLLPLGFLLKSGQPQAASNSGYKQSRPPSLGGSEMPVDDNSAADLTIVAKNQVKKKQAASKSWFGLKLFQSFVSPCRECQAVRPTMKANAAKQESMKLH